MKVVDKVKKVALLHGEKAVVGLLTVALLVTVAAVKPWSAEAPEAGAIAGLPNQLQAKMSGTKVQAPSTPEGINVETSWWGKDQQPFPEYKTPMVDLAKNELWAEYAQTRWPEIAAPKMVSVRPELGYNQVEFAFNYEQQNDNCEVAGWGGSPLALQRASLYRKHAGVDQDFQKIHEWGPFGNVDINEPPLAEAEPEAVHQRERHVRGVVPGEAPPRVPTRPVPTRPTPRPGVRPGPSAPFGEEAVRPGDEKRYSGYDEYRRGMDQDKRIREMEEREEQRRLMGERMMKSRMRSTTKTTETRRPTRTIARTSRTSTALPPGMAAANLLSSQQLLSEGTFSYEDTDIKGSEQYEYQVELEALNPIYDQTRMVSAENPRLLTSKTTTSGLITAAADLVWYFSGGMFAQKDKQPWASCTVYHYYRYDTLRKLLGLTGQASTPMAAPLKVGELELATEKKGQWFKRYFPGISPGQYIGGQGKVTVKFPGETKVQRVPLDFYTGNLVVDVTQDPMISEDVRMVPVFSSLGTSKKVEKVYRRTLPTLRLTYVDPGGSLDTRWRETDALGAQLRKEEQLSAGE